MVITMQARLTFIASLVLLISKIDISLSAELDEATRGEDSKDVDREVQSFNEGNFPLGNVLKMNRILRGGNNHYLRALRSSEEGEMRGHFLRSLRSGQTSDPHFLRSLKSQGDHFLRSIKSDDDNDYFFLRPLRSEPHFLRPLRSEPHFLRPLRSDFLNQFRDLRSGDAPVGHFLRSLRSINGHLLRALRTPTEKHFLRALRSNNEFDRSYNDEFDLGHGMIDGDDDIPDGRE